MRNIEVIDLTADRKQYLDSLWKDTLLGKYSIFNGNLEIADNERKRDEIAEKLFDPENPWITIHDQEKEFGKRLSTEFKDYSEWEEYILSLINESSEMKETVDVSGVTDGFLFIAGEILKGYKII